VLHEHSLAAKLVSSEQNLTGQQDHLKKQIKSLHKGSKRELQEEISNFESDVKKKEQEILDVCFYSVSKLVFLLQLYFF
jgi:Skp family chaperone for outer membrane proteins